MASDKGDDGFVETVSVTLISTPCIGVCRIDPDSDLCTGCARTLDEIADWGTMSEDQRRAVMAQLPARMAYTKLR